ncbi:hypothetical protein HYH03_004413 [Edaphochlamys debaryana]|uniref:BACK domain-containing protein n=1 Tax=Edaphochlamys debaryana TaxID=47281 RepID=A0A835YF81_9CHLO|nr:hypothetical protein HYH03_004413 [Edaphochlamys debaryana]|eukprot:KAG2497675.1 hypothetical protein HYH03_004413 [Edaphochlamys debaryana]
MAQVPRSSPWFREPGTEGGAGAGGVSLSSPQARGGATATLLTPTPLPSPTPTFAQRAPALLSSCEAAIARATSLLPGDDAFWEAAVEAGTLLDGLWPSSTAPAPSKLAPATARLGEVLAAALTDAPRILNSPDLLGRWIELPAAAAAAVLASERFGSAEEASVLQLVAVWTSANGQPPPPELWSQVRWRHLTPVYRRVVAPYLPPPVGHRPHGDKEPASPPPAAAAADGGADGATAAAALGWHVRQDELLAAARTCAAAAAMAAVETAAAAEAAAASRPQLAATSTPAPCRATASFHSVLFPHGDAYTAPAGATHPAAGSGGLEAVSFRGLRWGVSVWLGPGGRDLLAVTASLPAPVAALMTAAAPADGAASVPAAGLAAALADELEVELELEAGAGWEEAGGFAPVRRTLSPLAAGSSFAKAEPCASSSGSALYLLPLWGPGFAAPEQDAASPPAAPASAPVEASAAAAAAAAAAVEPDSGLAGRSVGRLLGRDGRLAGFLRLRVRQPGSKARPGPAATPCDEAAAACPAAETAGAR